jgi:hypothetical protein
MKRTQKLKLKLNTETVRVLDSAALREVVGGLKSGMCSGSLSTNPECVSGSNTPSHCC